MDRDRFKGKTVIITGGTSGIGAASAKAFASEGARVLIIGRNEEQAKSIKNEINHKALDSADYYICDVSRKEDVDTLRNKITKNEKHIDILFNNAGVFKTGSLERLDMGQWEESFKINVNGAMYMTQAFMNALKETHGCIINNASVSGLDSFTSGSKNYMYGSSKAALIKFSKLCALNYAKDVRVNVICPGIIDTEIYENRDFSRFYDVIPMGTIANTGHVTGLILFLASEEASYITGAVIPVDGGMSLM